MKNLPSLQYIPDIFLRIYPTGNRVWYLMPWEIILPEWESQIYGKYIVTSLGIYFYGRTFSDWLLCLTNLTPEQYYRKYILNIADNRIFRCPICDTIMEFKNLSHGYQYKCINQAHCNAMITFGGDGKFLSKRLNSV